MIRFIFIVSLLSSLSTAGVVEYFQAKTTNKVVCKVYFNGYKLISQTNATVEKIGMDTYFKLKKQNLYIPVSGCKVIRKESIPIFF